MQTTELLRYMKFGTQDVGTLINLLGGKQLVPYVGFIGYGNLGDEVLLEGHEALFPDYKFSVYRKEAHIVENIAKVANRKFTPYAFLGGGTLINRQNHWIDRVEYLLEQGTKLFCVGTGVANPGFWKGDNEMGGRTFNRWVSALNQFEFVGVRGPISKKLLDEAGVNNVRLVGDTALSLTEDVMKPKKQNGVIGFNWGDVVDPKDNPMWGDSNKYRAETIKSIKYLIKEGYKVRLLPIRDEDFENNRALMREINSPALTMKIANQTRVGYSKEIRECDIFIAQKLHAGVLSLMNRTPIVMVEYRPKCRDFMASLNLEKYVVKTSDFTNDTFVPILNDVKNNYQQIIDRAESNILKYKKIQFDEAKNIEKIIG